MITCNLFLLATTNKPHCSDVPVTIIFLSQTWHFTPTFFSDCVHNTNCLHLIISDRNSQYKFLTDLFRDRMAMRLLRLQRSLQALTTAARNSAATSQTGDYLCSCVMFLPTLLTATCLRILSVHALFTLTKPRLHFNIDVCSLFNMFM